MRAIIAKELRLFRVPVLSAVGLLAAFGVAGVWGVDPEWIEDVSVVFALVVHLAALCLGAWMGPGRELGRRQAPFVHSWPIPRRTRWAVRLVLSVAMLFLFLVAMSLMTVLTDDKSAVFSPYPGGWDHVPPVMSIAAVSLGLLCVGLLCQESCAKGRGISCYCLLQGVCCWAVVGCVVCSWVRR